MRAAPLLILLAFSIMFALPATPLAAQDPAPPATSAPDATTAPAPDSTTAPLRRIGNGVSVPQLLTNVEPKFSEQARAAKFSGMVLVTLIVDANGMPQDVHVLRGVGMGLDEEAVKAVKQYTFRPARENGKPVAVRLNVEVNFQVFDSPKVLHSVPLQLSPEAIQMQASGTILVALTVDKDGNPQNIHIARGVGMGMDELAVEAVRQYKFQPIVENGQPVAKPTTLQLKFDAK